jgi:peptidoglycan/LPS O-acetylase OafA/YrhL
MSTVFRSVIAVLAGYAAMSVLVVATTAALTKLWPSSSEEDQPTPAYIAVNLAYSSLFAAAGGYVTSALARRSPLGHSIALAGLVLVLGAIYSIQSSGGKQPRWYLALLPVLSAGGATAGGYIRTRDLDQMTERQ